MKRVLLAGVCMVAAAPAWGADEVVAATEASAAAAVEESDEGQAIVPEASDEPLSEGDVIVITGARTILPATALPLTYDLLADERSGADARG